MATLRRLHKTTVYNWQLEIANWKFFGVNSLSFLDDLNPQQREAVETTEGPVLILAGAGSGKTRVITYRIAHLIENQGVMPESILAMTFTNKAAAEMGERVEKLVGGLSIAKPVISTFHSFCVRVLRRDIEKLQIPSTTPGAPPLGHTRQFVIYDEADQQQLVKSVMRRLGIDDKQVTPRSVLAHISWAKNHMLDPQEVYLHSADPKTERVAHIYEEYRKELRKANALDFDDLLLETVRLLKAVPEVRDYYNRRFQYILVDEYQDTNRPQYELMRLLAGSRHNVCAVGDEDQSIYSWRGADIRNILEFENDFPEAKIVRLEQNYRSTQNILQAASAVVANNVKRKGKNLWTSRQGGAKIGYYEAPDGENEALFVADWMARYLREAAEQGETPRAAVLYRINSQSRLFEEAMRRYQLKYHVVGGFSFYERAEIKDMISYLKVIQNPDDSISLLRVINTPTRGIGKTTLETLERVALETGLSLWGATGEVIRRQLLPQRALSALKLFRDLIEDARSMLAGTYAERLTETAQTEEATESPAAITLPAEGSSKDEDATEFDPMAFEFGEQDEVIDTLAAMEDRAAHPLDRVRGRESEIKAVGEEGAAAGDDRNDDGAFRTPGGPATTAEILKFLIDRTRYIKLLEEEDTPEAYSRIENLRELVNAAMDSKDRGETLDQFLDHAALVSDADAYDERAQITLMTLHAAKGLEFPLVFLCGLEEGLFPHSRTMLQPDDIEEERRLCYVGMTRAMNTLILTRAVYRRRYGTDLPEASIPSRFLEEVPPQLLEDIGSPRRSRPRTAIDYLGTGASSGRVGTGGSPVRAGGGPAVRDASESSHYSYEDEDQSVTWNQGRSHGQRTAYSGKNYNSIDNIAEFFASRGKKFNLPKMKLEQPAGTRGFRPGQKVRHPKYGEGTVYRREGEGEEAKITVQFPNFGLKKLVEKYAQLEKA
ncbi:MAG TPA: UvrD-helicase domain-containing protein [Terriglobales bacterium]|nr:UvrD-helicase domain-containing protein [Terriglobales bacterium]